MSKLPQIRDLIIAILLICAGGLVVVYHQTWDGPLVSSGTTATGTVSEGPIQDRWRDGPHANTYVLNPDGENSTCARCHSPINFIPTLDEMPASCNACKFEVEPPPPLFAQDEWLAIDCKTCHKIDADGEVDPEFMWLNIAAIGEYASVEDSTELCMKCHTEYQYPGHAGIQMGGTHSAFGCTDCHDAHDTTSSCGGAGCHDSLDDSLVGHDSVHQVVNCTACHDAGDLTVGPSETHDEMWMPFINVPVDEEIFPTPYTSHNLQREVDCTRCHFADNPWGLSDETETGS